MRDGVDRVADSFPRCRRLFETMFRRKERDQLHAGRSQSCDVTDAVRIDSDGMITDRWSGLSFAHLHWQLEQNATP